MGFCLTINLNKMNNKNQFDQQTAEIWSTPDVEVISIKMETLGATGPSFDVFDNSIS